MANRSLASLVDDYRTALAGVLADFDRFRSIEHDITVRQSEVDRAKSALSSSISSILPLSESVEQTAAEQRLKADTSALALLRVRLRPLNYAGVEKYRQAAIDAAELLRIEAPRPEKPKRRRRKDKPASIADRMREVIISNPYASMWMSREWAKHLGCAQSSVADTDFYKSDALRDQRALAKARKRAINRPAPLNLPVVRLSGPES